MLEISEKRPTMFFDRASDITVVHGFYSVENGESAVITSKLNWNFFVLGLGLSLGNLCY